jgi:hypothetical protein
MEPNKYSKWGIAGLILSLFYFVLYIPAFIVIFPTVVPSVLDPELELLLVWLGYYAWGFFHVPVAIFAIICAILAWRRGSKKLALVAIAILVLTNLSNFGLEKLKDSDSPNWTPGWQTIDNSAYDFRYKVPPGANDSRDYSDLDSADIWDFGLGDLVVVVYEQPLNELCTLKEMPKWPGMWGGELDCLKAEEVELPAGKEAISVLVPNEEESDGWMSAIEQTPEQTIIIWYHDWSLSDEQVRERNLKILRSFEFGD